jgi:hypothetical protein
MNDVLTNQNNLAFAQNRNATFMNEIVGMHIHVVQVPVSVKEVKQSSTKAILSNFPKNFGAVMNPAIQVSVVALQETVTNDTTKQNA